MLDEPCYRSPPAARRLRPGLSGVRRHLRPDRHDPGSVRSRPDLTAFHVGLFITPPCWFTASTSFGGKVARSLTDTFAGIAPASAPLFVAAQPSRQLGRSAG